MSVGSNEPTVETSNRRHYPEAELNVIQAHYRTPICPINNGFSYIHNCHMVAVVGAERIIREMDSFNLLQHRVKGGVISPTLGNMRENVIPLSSNYNGLMDEGVFALFLHEDILARVYQYEMDVMLYRQARLKLGLGDPGRPPYKGAYPVVTKTSEPGPFTDHRVHATYPIARLSNDGKSAVVYQEHQMPGFGRIDAFPVLKTMLSIPFSILGNIQRLVRMLSKAGDLYYQDVLGLAQSIIFMWFWKKDGGYRFPDTTFTSAVLNSAHQDQWPVQYNHFSRENVTFAHYRDERFSMPQLMIPSPSLSIPSTSHSKGPMIFGPIDIVYDDDGGLHTSARKDSVEDIWINASDMSISILPCSCSSSSGNTAAKLPDYAPASPWNIEDWCGQVSPSSHDKDEAESKTAFLRGKDTHESVNDRLFRAGLLDPMEWIKFLDLGTLHV